MRLIILSGSSGSGKTSALSALEASARAIGATIGGVICRALFEGDRKYGIDWFHAGAAGPGKPFARALDNGSGTARNQGPKDASAQGPGRVPIIDEQGVRYGMWRFEAIAIAQADEAICGFLYHDHHGEARTICLVDEIGPLELDWGSGLRGALRALDAAMAEPRKGTGMSAIVAARPDIASRLMERWPGSIRLDLRAEAPLEVAARLLAMTGPG